MEQDAKAERPNLPTRFERIEEQLTQCHNILDTMKPSPAELTPGTDKTPTVTGLEETAIRIEDSTRRLRARLEDIAGMVGQL